MTEETCKQPSAKPDKTACEKLRPRFRRFVELIVNGGTGVDAMRQMGFKGKEPRIAASKLKARPDIQAAIAELEAKAMENAGITLTRTWIEVRRIAYFDPAKLVGDQGEHVPLHKIDEDTRAAIAGVEMEELFDGVGRERVRIGDVKKYRIASKLEANRLILQAKGDLVERHEDLTPRAPPVIQIVRYPDSKAEGDAGTDSPRAD